MTTEGAGRSLDDDLVAPRLLRALERGDLEVHYQPLVELPGGTVTGVEALARWTDEELGVVPPDVFVRVAERRGLIAELGRQVLATAARAAAGWVPVVGEAPLLSVNASALQLADASFPADVRAALADSGLPAQRLCLEVTETAAISDLDATTEVLEELRELGVQLALDDFGAGWSSLTVLHRLPVDIVKLDRSFVERVAGDERTALVVRLFVDAAHALGLSAVAEGVETQEQARQLVALGCDRAQGWLFGRPVPDLPVLPRTLSGRAASAWSWTPGEDAPVPLRGSDELVVRLAPTGVVTYVSTSVRTLLGRSPAELLGRTATHLVHPEDQGQDVAGPVRLRVRHREGGWRWFEARGQALTDARGRVRAHLWTARDVDDAVAVERALAESEALYRQTFDHAPAGVALSSLDGRLLRVNRSLADLLGRTVEELLELTVEDITHPEDRAADAGNSAALAAGVERDQVVVKRYLSADGSPVPVRVFVRVLPDLKGDPTFVVAHVLPRRQE